MGFFIGFEALHALDLGQDVRLEVAPFGFFPPISEFLYCLQSKQSLLTSEPTVLAHSIETHNKSRFLC